MRIPILIRRLTPLATGWTEFCYDAFFFVLEVREFGRLASSLFTRATLASTGIRSRLRPSVCLSVRLSQVGVLLNRLNVRKKGKGFPYSIPSVGPGADPGVQAVSLQVTVKSSTRR